MNLTSGFRGLTRIPRPLRPYRTPIPRANQKPRILRDGKESVKGEPEASDPENNNPKTSSPDDHRQANTADVPTGVPAVVESAASPMKRIAVFSTGGNWDGPTRRFMDSPSGSRANHLTGHDCSVSAVLVVNCLDYSDPEAHRADKQWLRA